MRLRRSSTPLLGMDLSEGRVRLMACSRKRDLWQVDCWAERELDPDSLQDGQLRQFDAVCGALGELVQKAGAGTRIALAVPQQATRHHVLAVPATVRPWAWRSWLREQAELLAGAPAESLAFDVQLLQSAPLTVLLSLCPREVLEDWQGLAEAAGLTLVLLDDRLRVMHLALQGLGLVTTAGGCVMAEVAADRCRLHVWRPAQARESLDWDGSAEVDLRMSPARGWLVGSAPDVALWGERLGARAGGAWVAVGLRARLDWSGQGSLPADPDAFLAAFGLAVRVASLGSLEA